MIGPWRAYDSLTYAAAMTMSCPRGLAASKPGANVLSPLAYVVADKLEIQMFDLA